MFADIDSGVTRKKDRKFLERPIPVKFGISEEELETHTEYVSKFLGAEALWQSNANK